MLYTGVDRSRAACSDRVRRTVRMMRRSQSRLNTSITSMVVALCVVYLASSVQAAPTSLPDCVPPTRDTCQPGYYAALCDPGRPVISGCRPCPEGTFSDTPSSITDKTSCRSWRTCDGPSMTYLWRGNATSDAVCQCTTGYHSNTSTSCIPDGAGTVSAEPAGGDSSLKAPAPWVGWVIVVTITASFIALMCVFWFWTPCLRGEPDFGDDGQGAYVKAGLHETEKLVNKDLTDEEDAVAITYAVKRLPGLVPLTPKYTQEFLSVLLKTASAPPPDTANGQSAEASQADLERGLQEWQNDPSHSARFADLVEAMSCTGYGQKALLLTQEVYTHLKHTNPSL